MTDEVIIEILLLEYIYLPLYLFYLFMKDKIAEKIFFHDAVKAVDRSFISLKVLLLNYDISLKFI